MTNKCTGIFNTNPPPSTTSTDSDTPILEVDENGVADFESNDSSGSWSYFSSDEFIELLFCIIPVAIGSLCELSNVIQPYQRPVPSQEIDGNTIYPFQYNVEEHGETVPFWGVGLASYGPALFQIAILFACKNAKTIYGRAEMVHKTLCVYTMGVGLTQMICNLAKLYCGYFRPFFLYYCEPNGNMECTGDWGDEQQSRKSFPSGHASLTTCGMLLFSYFLADTFGHSCYKRIASATARGPLDATTTTRPKPRRFVRIVEILCYTPTAIALWIAASRVHDDHHHPADVVGGCLLGGSVGTLVYNVWFS